LLCDRSGESGTFAAFAHARDSEGARLLLDDLESPSTSPQRAARVLQALLTLSPVRGIGIESRLLGWVNSRSPDGLNWTAVKILLAQQTSEGRAVVTELATQQYRAFQVDQSPKWLNSTESYLHSIADQEMPEALPLCTELVALVPETPEVEGQKAPPIQGMPYAGPLKLRLVRRALTATASMNTAEGIELLRRCTETPPSNLKNALAWEAIAQAIDLHPTSRLAQELGPELRSYLADRSPSENWARTRAALTFVGAQGTASPRLLLDQETELTGAPPDVRASWATAMAQTVKGSPDPEVLDTLRRLERSNALSGAKNDPFGRVQATVTEALLQRGTPEDRQLLLDRAKNGEATVAVALLKSSSSQIWNEAPGALDSLLERYDRADSAAGFDARELAFERLLGQSADPERLLARYDGTEDYRGVRLIQRLRAEREFKVVEAKDQDSKFLELMRELGRTDPREREFLEIACRAIVRERRASVSSLVASLADSSVADAPKLLVLRYMTAHDTPWTEAERQDCLISAAPSLWGSELERDYWCLVVVQMSGGPQTWQPNKNLLDRRRAVEGAAPSGELQNGLDQLSSFLDKYL
jgi:hypothetical protein